MFKKDSLVYRQKSTLVDNILRYIKETKAKSLLDIGAGSVETALPISQAVDVYLAIEQDNKSAQELKKVDIQVINGSFPISLDNTFDMVLSSHSIPERNLDAYSSFLSEAWERVNKGGIFLIVTFKGVCGDLETIKKELLNTSTKKNLEYESVISFFNFQGIPNVERINSYIEATSSENLADFLVPWISDDKEKFVELKSALIQIINSRYKVRPDFFIFPTQHLFISCKKIHGR